MSVAQYTAVTRENSAQFDLLAFVRSRYEYLVSRNKHYRKRFKQRSKRLKVTYSTDDTKLYQNLTQERAIRDLTILQEQLLEGATVYVSDDFRWAAPDIAARRFIDFNFVSAEEETP